MVVVLVNFSPWLILWICVALDLPREAAFIGFTISLITNLANIFRKRSFKILQIGTLIFFLALSVSVIVTDPEVPRRWASFAGSAALAVMALFSLIIRKPFTAPFAQEMVPPERVGAAAFVRGNYLLTWVWLAFFMFKTATAYIRLCMPDWPVWINAVTAFAMFFAAVKFTFWYKDHRM